MKNRHRMLGLLLALLMMIPFVPSVSHADALKSYIVHVDVKGTDSAYAEAVERDDLSEAIRVANRVLDGVEEKIREAVGAEITGRVQLVLPSLMLQTEPSNVERIRRIPGVSEVYPDLEFQTDYVRDREAAEAYELSLLRGGRENGGEAPAMIKSPGLIGLDEELANRYDGRGTVLGIIDANMDPTHRAYYLNDFAEPRLKVSDIARLVEEGSLNSGKYSTVENLYRSAKIPFGWNYMNKDADLNEENEVEAHGQHVSGTVAGNATTVNGKRWRGVAPNAQLLMMNVMRNGSTSAGLYLQAMQDSLLLGADAVNMSLGSTKGVAGAPNVISKAFEEGFSQNTNFVVAAGNEGEYQGDINIDTPDYGTIATPGVYRTALTVASLENKIMASKFLYLSGVPFTYAEATGYTFPAGNYDYVDAGWGRPEDFNGKNLQGKVALIERGKLTFTDKVYNAQKRGAIGVVIYNNTTGSLNMQVDKKKVRIPSISVSQEDGKAMLASKVQTFVLKDEMSFVPNPEYGEISGFSNWGLTAEGYLKPDITAPGGNILSLQNKGDTFGSMSGTSMATPHVTGAVGVLRQYMRESKLYRDIENKAKLTKTLLMNSAEPHRDPVTAYYTSPRRQGAGVLNIANALELDYTVVMSKDQIPSGFIGNVNDELHFDLEVTNYSDEWRVLTPTIDATVEAKEGKKLLLRPDGLFSATLYNQKIQVAPKSTKKAHIRVPIENLHKLDEFEKGAFVEGFLRFFDRKGKYATVAFVSYKGDFGKLHSIEKPIYEFDFTKEHPMYWNVNFRANPWHKFSTHIETEVGTHENEYGQKIPTEKIMGLKNFDEIDRYKNTADEPKPIFEPMIFSPNKDGYNDKFRLYSVLTRGAVIRVELVDEYGDVLESREETYPKSISFLPDETGRAGLRGFQKLYELTQQYDDGDYTLRIVGRALNEHGTEPNPETVDEIRFRVDQTAPAYENVTWNEAERILRFRLQETSFLREVKAEYRGTALPLQKEEDTYVLKIDPSYSLEEVKLEAVDGGYNRGKASVALLLRPEEFGNLKVDVKTGGSNWDLELNYRVLDAEGREVEKTGKLKAGNYRLLVDSYSYKYEMWTDEEIPFVIQAGKDTTVELEFEIKRIERLALKIEGLDGLDPNDVKVWAISKSDGQKIRLLYKDYVILRYYEEYVPVGEYTFETEFREGVKGYRMKISHDVYKVKPGKREKITIEAESYDPDSEFKINIQSKPGQKFIIMKKELSGNYSPISPDALRPGTYAVLPIEVPEGFYVYPPVQEVTLDDETQTKDLRFDVKSSANAGFVLTMEDQYPAGKYQIEDAYVIYGVKGGVTRELNGKSERLAPGKYRITAIPDEDKHGWPAYKEEKHPIVVSENENVTISYEWSDYDPQRKSAVIVYIDQQELEDHELKTRYKFSLKPKVGDIIRDTWTLPSHVMMLPYGSYTPFIEGLPQGYSVSPKMIPVYEPLQDIFLTIVREMPELENKGRALWNFTYKGEKTIQPEVKLYRIETNGNETYLGTPNKEEIQELEYGKYAFVMSSLGEDLVIENDRLEFTMSKDKQWFKGMFRIVPKKKKIYLNLFEGDKPLKNLHIRAMDSMGDEAIAVQEGDGYYFLGTEGEEYELEIYTDEDAFDEFSKPYYPNRLVVAKNQTPVDIRVSDPIKVTVQSLLKGKNIDPSYRFEWKNGNVSYVGFNEKNIPYIQGPNPTVRVEYTRLDRDKFYIVGSPVQEFVIDSPDKTYELTFQFTDESPSVDKTELAALIDEYNIIRKTARYRNAERKKQKAYDDAIDDAIRLNGNDLAGQEEVNRLVADIKIKRDAIVGSLLEAAREELSVHVDRDPDIRAGRDFRYAVEESKQTYVQLIERAKAILNETEPATGREIYALIQKIEDAVAGLVGVEPQIREELKNLVGEFETVKESPLYRLSGDSVKREYELAIFAGKKVMENTRSTEKETQEAIDRILQAKAKLNGVEAPTEDSDAPNYDDAYENDIQVSGSAVAGAEVYAEVNGETYGPTRADERGKFAISVARLRVYDKINIHTKEHGKRESRKIPVIIQPMDRLKLQSLVTESDWLKKSETYRRALPAVKQKYDQSIDIGRRYLREREITQREINDAVQQIKAAKQFLQSNQRTGKANSGERRNTLSLWTAVAYGNSPRRPH